ncbi:Interferon-induced 6-16 containing protein [Cricetulus griseus]|uniref:Interferon-induced 6-16 containing protein n=1 Tax=Cricetulus griseus TaxID=10029 RepID=A0A061I3V8_CRIGR|nr:Interferon-induced 6-16 containing protein [Cricetulus griseus]
MFDGCGLCLESLHGIVWNRRTDGFPCLKDNSFSGHSQSWRDSLWHHSSWLSGAQPVSPDCPGLGASALGSSLGALKVGTILSVCPASVLAVGPTAAKAAAAVLGGAITVAAVPPVLSAVGFTGAGIAASSLAAKMMSLSAIANGGGVAAGGLVATLQSVGAAGLSMSSKLLLGSAGSTLMARVMGI